MKPFSKFTGLVAPMDRVNVDTDAIIPKQFLKRIQRSGFGQFLFYEYRYSESGELNKDFVLNQDRFKSASILIARANFGCGSSREHAPWALLDYGFKVIIAPSFADIFYSNCINNGILPIKLSHDIVDELFKKTNSREGFEIQVDLENKRITEIGGSYIDFDIEEAYRKKMLAGLDDIGITLNFEDKILAYESIHSSIQDFNT